MTHDGQKYYYSQLEREFQKPETLKENLWAGANRNAWLNRLWSCTGSWLEVGVSERNNGLKH